MLNPQVIRSWLLYIHFSKGVVAAHLPQTQEYCGDCYRILTFQFAPFPEDSERIWREFIWFSHCEFANVKKSVLRWFKSIAAHHKRNVIAFGYQHSKMKLKQWMGPFGKAKRKYLAKSFYKYNANKWIGLSTAYLGAVAGRNCRHHCLASAIQSAAAPWIVQAKTYVCSRQLRRKYNKKKDPRWHAKR